jgi:hypothetical protein
MSFNNRSDALIELLDEVTQEGREYVLVGGYAVSAFNARFSTDLDIVVAPQSKGDFIESLEDREFKKTDSHAKEWFYDTEVIEYEKRLTPQQPIGFDLLMNGLGCRQTEAQWSFDYLYNQSSTLRGDRHIGRQITCPGSPNGFVCLTKPRTRRRSTSSSR